MVSFPTRRCSGLDLLVRVVANWRRILFFVAAVAVIIREVFLRLDEVRVGLAPRRGCKEFLVDERNVLFWRQVAPKIFCEQCGERDEPNRQPREEKIRAVAIDRKSTRLNSSHLGISYAVFCL